MFVSENLTMMHWIEIMRIVIGLWWIKSVLHKEYPKFVKTGMMSWTNSLLDNHPWPAVVAPIRKLINLNPTVFPYLVVLGEAAVGIGMVLGFLTPLAVVVAILLNANYLLTAGAKPKDYDEKRYNSVNPCFRVEQGQNLVMIIAEIVIFAVGAWQVLALDATLGLFQF
ncbi:MAG: DoxX family protein [Chloroflexi bacterium]|nr:MAG: DoxX family protein [Chloroflexota bacterium]